MSPATNGGTPTLIQPTLHCRWLYRGVEQHDRRRIEPPVVSVARPPSGLTAALPRDHPTGGFSCEQRDVLLFWLQTTSRSNGAAYTLECVTVSTRTHALPKSDKACESPPE